MITPKELYKGLISLRNLAVQAGGPDWFIREEVSKLVEIVPSASTVVFDPSKYLFVLNNVILPVVPLYPEHLHYQQFKDGFSSLIGGLALMDTAWRMVGEELRAE